MSAYTSEHLKFCIERFDHFYDSVNNKSALFIAVNTFIVGGLMAMYSTIQTLFECGFWINTFLILIVFSGVISVLFTLWAGIPYLSKPDKSNLYFRSIASKDLGDFKTEVLQLTEEDLHKDYIEQIHRLSLGLQNKFRRLQIAGYLIFFEFVISIPFIILLLNNVKK